jgi:hypothetical protein
MPVHPLRLPVDRVHQQRRVAGRRRELRIDKRRDRFEFLDKRTDDEILTVRRKLIDNRKSEAPFTSAW